MIPSEQMHSALAALGSEGGYTDLLAVLRTGPRETNLLVDLSSIRAEDVLKASSFNADIKQTASRGDKAAGEGFDPNTFEAGVRTFRSSAKIPLFVPRLGFVDHAFSTLWDCAKFAPWGTASSASGRILGGTLSSGSTAVQTDNIADFAALTVPFSASFVKEGTIVETVIVTAASKQTRTLTIGATTSSHDSNTLISARPNYTGGPTREPAFSLVSLREGVFAPCLVNKITIEANVDTLVESDVEFASLSLLRGYQAPLRAIRGTVQSKVAHAPPVRVIEGYAVRISSISAAQGTFGLSAALGDDLFAGWQGLRLESVIVSGISITVDNNLTETWTAHSLDFTNPTRQRRNTHPFALFSGGRTISGKIRYRAPIDPWIVAERLSGPSSLAGGGLVVDYGSFKITLTEIVWEPSQGEANVEEDEMRTLNFQAVCETYDGMPILEASSQT